MGETGLAGRVDGDGTTRKVGAGLRPSFDVVQVADDRAAVRAYGPWTIDGAADASHLMARYDPAPGIRAVTLDLASLGGFDTSGAFILHRFRQRMEAKGLSVVYAHTPAGFETLIREIENCDVAAGRETEPVTRLADGFAEIGEATQKAGLDVVDSLSMLGRIMSGFGKAVFDPRLFRITSIVHHMEHTGLRAVPIIALMSFLIGAIIAQQGAFQLRAFGGEIFVVDLVGILVLREIGVLLTAIMVAGRSGSAFTAEIGSMKMREEIDAMRIIGLDPIEVLALPRVVALMIVLPLLTFIAGIMCILGAMVVAMTYSSIQPEIFAARLQEAVGISDVIVGFIKAPFMALMIGLIACVEGLRVEGSTESLGQQTTASVVKSIFMVIVMDGVFAIYFAAIGW